MQPGRSNSPDASALEHLPHLAGKICELWGKEEFENHLNTLIMDSRDGRRQGLPLDVVEELLFLEELTIAKRALLAAESTGVSFRQAFREHLDNSRQFAPSRPGATDDPWSNPRDRLDIGRGDRSAIPARTTPVKRGRTHGKKSWWSRLVGRGTR